MTIIRFKLSVDVLRLVTWVLVVLETLTVCHIIALKINHYSILANHLICFWNVDSMIEPKVWSVFTNLLLVGNYFSYQISFVINKETLCIVLTLYVISLLDLGQIEFDSDLSIECFASLEKTKSNDIINITDNFTSESSFNFRQEFIAFMVWIFESLPITVIININFDFLISIFLLTHLFFIIRFFVSTSCCRFHFRE